MKQTKSYARALRPLKVQDAPFPTARIVKTLDVGERIAYRRVVLRGGREWLKVVLEPSRSGYVLRNKKAYSIDHLHELSDSSVVGLRYESKVGATPPFEQVFRPAPLVEPSPSEPGLPGVARLKREIDERKSQHVSVAYDPAATQVDEFHWVKGQLFFVTRKRRSAKDVTMEVEGIDGTTGTLLSTVSSTELRDKWLHRLAACIAAVLCLATFLALLSQGLIVVGVIMLVPGAIAGGILALLIYVMVKILGALCSPILKRL